MGVIIEEILLVTDHCIVYIDHLFSLQWYWCFQGAGNRSGGFAARSMVVVAASRLEQPLGRLRPSAFQPLVETRNAVVSADFNCNFPQAFGIRAKGSFMLLLDPSIDSSGSSTCTKEAPGSRRHAPKPRSVADACSRAHRVFGRLKLSSTGEVSPFCDKDPPVILPVKKKLVPRFVTPRSVGEFTMKEMVSHFGA